MTRRVAFAGLVLPALALRLGADVLHAATCTGADACKNCSSCKRCAWRWSSSRTVRRVVTPELQADYTHSASQVDSCAQAPRYTLCSVSRKAIAPGETHGE